MQMLSMVANISLSAGLPASSLLWIISIVFNDSAMVERMMKSIDTIAMTCISLMRKQRKAYIVGGL